jgi:phosphoribosylamine--glycine ligase
MKILIIGSGGREHALSWALQDPKNTLYVWPGNPGMKKNTSLQYLPSELSRDQLIDFCRQEAIDLTLIGPENYICEGWADLWEKSGLNCLAPLQYHSQLESSKLFSKKLLKELDIPTAEFHLANNETEAREKYKTFFNQSKVVLKYDGLAAGKGVCVCQDQSDFEEAMEFYFTKNPLNLNPAPILMEELLEGPEVSCFALSDGEDFLYLGDACDYKNLLDGNKGPNTGGMGSYAPADWISTEQRQWIKTEIFEKLFDHLKQSAQPYRGFLFAGLMQTNQGLKVIEFNVRMGDPETQSLLPLIKDQFPAIINSFEQKQLSQFKKEWDFELVQQSAVHIVKASNGYPGSKGEKIQTGLPIIEKTELHAHLSDNAQVFYAGVKENNQNQLITSGGRVLGISTIGGDRQQARHSNYQINSALEFENEQMRKDIGL